MWSGNYRDRMLNESELGSGNKTDICEIIFRSANKSLTTVSSKIRIADLSAVLMTSLTL